MFGRQRNKQNPGRFRSLLELQPSTEGQGAGADSQPSWSTSQVIPVHGLWVQLNQSQSIMAQARFGQVSGRWEIPWCPDVTTEHRVKYLERFYRIVGIDNPEERNRELHLYCVEDGGAVSA
jgi:head-tail adaptor